MRALATGSMLERPRRPAQHVAVFVIELLYTALDVGG